MVNVRNKMLEDLIVYLCANNLSYVLKGERFRSENIIIRK